MVARCGNPRQRESPALGHVARTTAKYPIPWTLTPKKTTDTLPAVLIFRPVEVLLIGEYGFRMRFRTGQEPVTSVLYLFDTKAWIEILQFSCRFKRNNAVIRDHQQDRVRRS